MTSFDAGINLKVKVLDEQLDKLESRIEKISKRGVFGSGDSKQFQAAQKRQKQLEEAAATERRLAKIRAESVDIANRGTLKKLKAEEQYRKELQSTIEEIRKRNRLIQQQEANRNQFPGGVNNPLPFTRAGQGKVRSSVDRLEAKRNEQLKQRQKLASTVAFQTKLELQFAQRLSGVEKLITKEQQKQISAGQSLAAQKKTALDAAEREAKLAERTAAAEKKRAKSKASKGLQSAALGVGFPLLFGGGAGSIAGGLLGSAGGFGGQILGSAIGQQVDQFITKAAELGQALSPLTGDFEKVSEAAGLSGTALGKLIQEYESVAGKEAALAEATAALSRAIGQDAVNSLEKFGEESLRLGNELTIALTSISAAIADIINKTGILRALADNFDFIRNRDRGLENRGQDPELARLIAERDKFNKGKLFGGDNSKRFEAEQAIAARQAELDIVEQTEQTNRLIADTEAKKTQEIESNLTLVRQRLLIEKGNNDLLDESVVKAKRAIAAEETRLALIKAQGDMRLIELALLEGSIKRVQIDNAVADAKKRQADIEARLASKGSRSAEQAARKELQAKKAIAQEKAKQFELEVKLQTLGRTELDQVQIQLDNFDKITSLKRNQIVLATEDARVEAEKLQTLDLQRTIERDQLILRKQSLELAEKTQAIQARQSVDSLQRGLSQELAGITTPSNNKNLDERNAQALAQAQRYENALAGINDQLEVQKVLATSSDDAVSGAAEKRISQLTRQKAVYEEMLPQIFAAEQAQLKFNQVLQAAQPYAEAFATGLTQGLRDVVAGTKTAEEAFADFLSNIADMLIQTAATMIAQYIAIGIARKFAGIPGGSSGSDFSQFGSNTSGVPTNFIGSGLSGFAEGGYVTSPTPALVGEGGEPELIIPESKLDGAMRRWSAGQSGNQLLADGGEMIGGGGTALADQPMQINISGGVTQIGNEDYIRKDQLPGIIAQAGKAGEARTLRRLQMSPGTRARAGI